jgi:hypothetical protein
MRVARALAAVAVVVVTSSPIVARAQTDGFEPVIEGLNFAVNLAFLPDGRILVAEKATGQIRVVEDGDLLDEPLVTLPVDATANETGLLGLAVDRDFPDQPWIYAYYSDATDGMNRLVRMRLDGDEVGAPETLFDEIATTPIHNGGDIAVGVDGRIFLVTGDGAESTRSQDVDDPHGKVLRFERDGAIPPHNPQPGSPVYASGIRNSFGLCIDPDEGSLWETENGPESWDEVNLIGSGENHGWPDQLGPGGEPTYVDPVIGFEQVIVPTGCAALRQQSVMLFGDFGGRLHELSQLGSDTDSPVDDVIATFPDGITDVAIPNDGTGTIYVLTTSTLYRATDAASIGPEGLTTSPAPANGADGGFGTALRNTAGLVVLAVLVAGFFWLRGRALRR